MFEPDFDVDYEINRNSYDDDNLDISILKKHISNNKNKNIRMVKVRKPHKCMSCGKLISVGEICLTVNIRGTNGRFWICKQCLDAG